MEGNKKYKPGFFCVFFWVLTWFGMGGMGSVFLLAVFFGVDLTEYFIPLTAGSILSAAVSYVIRSVEKSRHDGRRSFHVND